MTNLQKLILLTILIIAVFFRFNKLDQVPAGLHSDGASQGFNAYSLGKTGRDMYGQKFPILFRANGSYQPPIYTYLSIIPVAVFGNTAFSITFLSALSGSLLVLITFLLIKDFGIGGKKENVWLALLCSSVLAITPWAIHFSRLAVEANLAVMIFALALYTFLHSTDKKYLFPVGCILLGLASHAYYTEKVIAIIFLPFFLIIFRKTFWTSKKIVLVGLLLFFLSQIPYLYIAKSGALTKRFSQSSYLTQLSEKNDTFFSSVFFVGNEFVDHYLTYFSPGNLFFDSGSQLGRTTPDLSVFYPWFFVPFLFGVGGLLNRRGFKLSKILFVLALISPLAAGLTGDLFYPLRVLSFMWVITIIIAFGTYELFLIIKPRQLALVIFGAVMAYSILIFHISYFTLFKFETNQSFGYPYMRLMQELPKYKDRQILLDASSRSWGAGIRMTYLAKVDPLVVQENLSSQLTTPYYSAEINANEVYVIDNITVKTLDWSELCQKST